MVEIMRLLSPHFMAKSQSFREELSGEYDLKMEVRYSVLAFEILHSLFLEVARLLKTFLPQYLL